MTARKTLFSILTLAVLVAAVAFGSVAQPSQAQDPSSPAQRFIRVTGSGSAAGAPDVVYMGLGVDSTDPDINAALADNNSRIEAIKAALSELGIASTDVRTEYFNIWRDTGYYDPNMPDANTPTFRISHSLYVVLHDTTKVGEVLGAVINAGATTVNYVNFDIADRGALEADARIDALADARDRAQQLADQLGVTLGEVISVVEYSNSGYYPTYDMAGGAGGGAGNPPITAGNLSVGIQLEVTFSLQ